MVTASRQQCSWALADHPNCSLSTTVHKPCLLSSHLNQHARLTSACWGPPCYCACNPGCWLTPSNCARLRWELLAPVSADKWRPGCSRSRTSHRQVCHCVKEPTFHPPQCLYSKKDPAHHGSHVQTMRRLLAPLSSAREAGWRIM